MRLYTSVKGKKGDVTIVDHAPVVVVMMIQVAVMMKKKRSCTRKCTQFARMISILSSTVGHF
jgi:hypothetical protein